MTNVESFRKPLTSRLTVQPSAGAHIAFTGIDGSGKTTQAGLLRKRLEDAGYWSYLAENKEDFAVRTMQAIARRHGFESPRAYYGNEGVEFAKSFDTLREHIYIIGPMRAAGCVVVQPRSAYCRVAVGMTYGSANINKAEEVVHLAGEPDLTLWLDTSVQIALERVARRGHDTEEFTFLSHFREKLALLNDRYRWTRVPGDGDIAEAHDAIWNIVGPWLSSARPIRDMVPQGSDRHGGSAVPAGSE